MQIKCINKATCNTDLKNVSFTDNQAYYSGGAIYYDSFRPSMEEVTFSGNTVRSYGPNIASYPVKVILLDNSTETLHIENTPPGQEYDQTLQFGLVDYDEQIITSTSTGTISIFATTPGGKALGSSSAPIVSGIATFKGVIFEALPGSQRVEYSLRSSVVDEGLLEKSLGTTSIQDPFYVSFRYCKPGEQDQGTRCSVCTSGSYSFEWNSTHCTS